MSKVIDFRTDPASYRHWRVEYEGSVANLFMDVDENGGLFDGYQLKLNSYDLSVDIELNDIVQRMRFEHPEVKVVVLQSGKDKVCLLYTSPSPRDKRQSRMPSSA